MNPKQQLLTLMQRGDLKIPGVPSPFWFSCCSDFLTYSLRLPGVCWNMKPQLIGNNPRANCSSTFYLPEADL